LDWAEAISTWCLRRLSRLGTCIRREVSASSKPEGHRGEP